MLLLENNNNDLIIVEKNFKLLMNSYIMENYFLFNNITDSSSLSIYNIFESLNIIFLKIENIFIYIQKVNYDYFSFIFDLFNWYFNYKILLDKIKINSVLIENLYYNLSLDLLLDIQCENLNSFFWITNHIQTEQDSYYESDIENITHFSLFKNYFQILKNNPYKINLELMHLYKLYNRSNFISYGIDYDINVISNSKYFFSFNDTEILYNAKFNKLKINLEYFDKYKISNYKIVTGLQSQYFNDLLYWNVDYWVDNVDLDDDNIYIYDKYDKLILDQYNKSKYFYEKWSMFIWNKYAKRRYTIIDNKVFKQWGWFENNEFIQTRINTKINNKKDLKFLFGSYTYWWNWHQDATYLYGEKGPQGARLKNNYTHVTWHKFNVWYKLMKYYAKRGGAGADSILIGNKRVKLPKLNASMIKEKDFFMPKIVPKFKLKENMRHGTRVVINFKGKIRKILRWIDFFKWDVNKKSRLKKYIIHGRYAWNLERKFFKSFLLSDDIWIKNKYEKNTYNYNDPKFMENFSKMSPKLKEKNRYFRISQAEDKNDFSYLTRKERFKYNLVSRARYNIEKLKLNMYKNQYKVSDILENDTISFRYYKHNPIEYWKKRKLIQYWLKKDPNIKLRAKNNTTKELLNQYSFKRKKKKQKFIKYWATFAYKGLSVTDEKNIQKSYNDLVVLKYKKNKYSYNYLNKNDMFYELLKKKSFPKIDIKNKKELFSETNMNKVIYKNFFNKLKLELKKSKILHKRTSSKPLRGFYIKQLALDVWLRKEKIILSNYIFKNEKITWDSFYTNIESVSEPLNLNYINKIYYGGHLNENMSKYLMGKNDIYNNVQLPNEVNVFLNKTYIENLIYVYQREEEPMINYIYSRLFFVEIWSFIREIYIFCINISINIFELYHKICTKYIPFTIKKIINIKIINDIINFININKEYIYKYIFISLIIIIYNSICWVLILLIKNSLPKNLIYGIKTYQNSNKLNIKEFLYPINNNIGKTLKSGSFSYIDKYLQNMNFKEDLYKKIYSDFWKNLFIIVDARDPNKNEYHYKYKTIFESLLDFKLKINENIEKEWLEKGLDNNSIKYLNLKINKIIENKIKSSFTNFDALIKIIDKTYIENNIIENEDLEKDEEYNKIIKEIQLNYDILNNRIKQNYTDFKSSYKFTAEENKSITKEHLTLLNMKTDNEIYEYWVNKFDDLETNYLNSPEAKLFDENIQKYLNKKKTYWEKKYKDIKSEEIKNKIIELEKVREDFLVKDIKNKFYIYRKALYLEKQTNEYIKSNIEIEQKNFSIYEHNLRFEKITQNSKKLFKRKENNEIYLKKNFFDAEHNYIYRWEDNAHAIWAPVRTYNNLERKKKLIINKNYKIFYKRFIFENNLEKWENNTKIRAPLELWTNKITDSSGNNSILKKIMIFIYSFIKLTILDYRDRIYNHNRIMFWENNSLEKQSKITYYFKIPKIFFYFFVLIRYTASALRIFNIFYWIEKWKRQGMYNENYNISYSQLMKEALKRPSVEWYKDTIDYDVMFFYKDCKILFDKINLIKKRFVHKEKLENVEKYHLILKIIEATTKDIKYKNIFAFNETMNKINERRKLNELEILNKVSFDNLEGEKYEYKFNTIKKELILIDINNSNLKEKIEQKLMYKYRFKVFNLKLKDNYEKTLIMYEKELREFNFINEKIDSSLDSKEKYYFESIQEYRQDLEDEYENILQIKKMEDLKKEEYEKKSEKLYEVLKTDFVYFRWFTTMGARWTFVLSQIVNIFLGWVENIKKIDTNEYSIESLGKMLYVDSFTFIYRMYWEYLIIWKKYKTIKKFGFNLIDILKFSLILSPIIIYTGSLYILFYIYFIYKIINKIIFNNIYVVYNIILQYKFLNWLKLNLSKYNFLLKIIFKDLETGNTIFDNIYNIFFKICGLIQRNYYFIEGAFILGYKEQKIFGGLKNILYLFKLKYKVFIEQQQGKIKNINFFNFLKKNYINQKEKINVKIQIIRIMYGYDYFFFKVHSEWTLYLYYIFGYIFNMDIKIFLTLYENNITFWRLHYSMYIFRSKMLLKVMKKLKFSEIIILLIKWSFRLLTLPLIIIIDHQKWKYIRNYKKGIQGFRENPMYKIIDDPKIKNDWRLKLHNLLMENRISRKLQYWKVDISMVDVFFIYKVKEVVWAKKNIYQDYFWRRWRYRWNYFRGKFYDFFIDWARAIENGYQSFELHIMFQNYSFWERLKYTYFATIYNKDLESHNDQKAISRNLFFRGQIKEKRKLQRIYFIKGILNWLSYIITNKVIFTKVEEFNKIKSIKYNGFKYRHIKYKFKWDKSIHLTKYLKQTPPQLWSLIILYDIYFKLITRYIYHDSNYPKKWTHDMIENEVFKKSYKWRLASPEYFNEEIDFTDIRDMAESHYDYDFVDLLSNLDNLPYDPMLRWGLFLLEQGFTCESIVNKENNELWAPELEQEVQRNLLYEEVGLPVPDKQYNTLYEEYNVWIDISLTHFLTYNGDKDGYKYEVRNYDYRRKLKNWYLTEKKKIKDQEKDKKEFLDEQIKKVFTAYEKKNRGVLDYIVKARKYRVAQMLYNAFLRHKTTEERTTQEHRDRENDYFYQQAWAIFNHYELLGYFEKDLTTELRKPKEEKYFYQSFYNNATYTARQTEEFCNRFKIAPPDLRYLLENVILKSYELTLDEILEFLRVKIIKVLNKKKNITKIRINYKNLYIRPSYFKKINYLEYKEEKNEIITPSQWVPNSVTGELEFVLGSEKTVPAFYKYKYEPFVEDWERLIREPVYNFVENEIFDLYSETGGNISYNERIEFNKEARKYIKSTRSYHGHENILEYWNFIRERNYGVKRLRKNIWNKKTRKRIILTVGYVNNIRWSWEQWLGYGDIDTENEILKKNIIVLNERYRLWYLKRSPMRIKLPIALGVWDDHKEYFQTSANYASYEHRSYLLAQSIEPLIKDSIKWQMVKKELRRLFGQNVADIVYWTYSKGVYDSKVAEVREKYAFVVQNLMLHYNVFQKLYFLGLPQYSWDLMRYLWLWAGEDEPPIPLYFQLKQNEYLMHDPELKVLIQSYYDLAISRYNPANYVFFFKHQYRARYLYYVYNLISYISIFWFLKVLFYNPGEYVANYFMLIIPFFIFLFTWFLKSTIKDSRDISAGGELYLYKYHHSKYRTTERDLKIELRKAHMEELTEIKYMYSRAKILDIYGSIRPRLESEVDPNWWQNYSHKISKNNSDVYTPYEFASFFIIFVCSYIGALFWKKQAFKYRNSSWFWEYYFVHPTMQELFTRVNKVPPLKYSDRQFLMDSFTRLEEGGNIYSRYYENFYKVNLRGEEPMPLDYGYSWQTIQAYFNWHYRTLKRNVSVPLLSSYGDALWLDFSVVLEKLPKDLKHHRNYKVYRYVTKLRHKKRLKYKGYNRVVEDEVNLRKKERRNYEYFVNMDLNFTKLNPLYRLKSYYKRKLKKFYIELNIGDEFIRYYNPRTAWRKFLSEMEEIYGFKPDKNIFSEFLLKNTVDTRKLIIKDLNRYLQKKDLNIFNYSKFWDNKKEIFLMKNKSFETGESLDLKIVLSINEFEKHLQIYYYNFLKYKLNRLVFMLTDPKFNFRYFVNTIKINELYIDNFYKEYQENWLGEYLPKKLWRKEKRYLYKIYFLKTQKQMKKNLELLQLHSETHDLMFSIKTIKAYELQSEQYIKNIFQIISYEDKLEYKYSLLLKLWNEKEISWWSWHIIKNIFNNSNFLEIFDILIKFINNII
jgi:hypothetical protein